MKLTSGTVHRIPGTALKILLLVVSFSSAVEASDTATIGASVTVVRRARILSVDDIDFGEYDPTDPQPVDATGSVTLRATQGMTYRVFIGENRSMTDGTDALDFELYSDAGRSDTWGSTAATSESFVSSGNAATALTLYGRIDPLQGVQEGLYAGVVPITVEW